MMKIFLGFNPWLLLPIYCLICGQKTKDHPICFNCTTDLAPLGASCKYCAQPLARHPNNDPVCGACCRKKPNIDQVFTNLRFEEPLRTLIHQFKYQHALYLKKYLASLILQALPQSALESECLMPIPIHRKKLAIRGFNQSAELCKELAKQLKKPYDLLSCQKIIHTPAQAETDLKERSKNIRGSFQVKPIKHQHITLIDDLITSGSTANELALTLKKQGVKQVDLWCCAKASAKI